MTPTNVVFDIGGVLIDWNPAYLYRKLLRDDESVARFLAEICTPSWNEQFDAGTLFAEGIAERSARFPEHAELIEAYWSRWHEMLGGEVEGTSQVLARLKSAGVPVHAISNWSAETFPRAQAIFPFLGDFDVLVVSGRERLIKPDAAIFELFLQRADVRAEDCIFIDDNPANIAEASRLGFQTEHFQSAAALERRLSSLGLLAPLEEEIAG